MQPTTMGITIIGAAILRFSGMTNTGKTMETRQVVYITPDSDKTFLSREACTALGLITKHFPTIGEAISTTTDKPINNGPGHTSPIAPCGCPLRQQPPPKPNGIPFPATEANREKLQSWLLNHYKSSTFNTCEHQPLPLMASIPMRLMVDPEATPVAHHTPVPIPLHWQASVKANLDQDTALGVIKPVPVGEPVTLCHRMVV